MSNVIPQNAIIFDFIMVMLVYVVPAIIIMLILRRDAEVSDTLRAIWIILAVGFPIFAPVAFIIWRASHIMDKLIKPRQISPVEVEGHTQG